jgi:hypothetical protein
MSLEKIPLADFNDLLWIMAQESSGVVGARNHTSSARGLFQLLHAQADLNPNGERSFGNAVEECQGGIHYIMGRYHSARAARTFWETPLVLTLRASLLFAAFLTTGASFAICADSPRFDNYPAAVEVVKKPAQVRISDAQSRLYRTQLREASRHAPNFAGHYVLATWGCGASCVMAAAIDAKTGAVTRLPFTVSNWPLDVTEPLDYKADSRLLIVRGSRNEKRNGIYYYEFVQHNFKLLRETEPRP